MDVSEATLEEIAESISDTELQAIQYLKGQEYLVPVREKIEAQTLSTEEIVGQYTKNQYVQQKIEVIPGLSVTLRTIPPYCMDEAIEFATAENGGIKGNFERTLTRRRLSHALIEINNDYVAGIPIDGSYSEHAKIDLKSFKDQLKQYADKVYGQLLVNGLAEKISEAFGVWESVVFNRINGIDDVSDTIKNSTRGSAKEQ